MPATRPVDRTQGWPWPGAELVAAGFVPHERTIQAQNSDRQGSALPLRIRRGYAAQAPPTPMRPVPVRLPADLIHWLDQARESEPRSTLIRQILRDEQRRQQRAQARHERQARP